MSYGYITINYLIIQCVIVMGIHIVIYFFGLLLFFFKLIPLIKEKHLYFMQFTILNRYACIFHDFFFTKHFLCILFFY